MGLEDFRLASLASRPISILFVEDNVLDQRIIARSMESRQHSYDYIIVDTISAATELLESRYFDVVVLDYCLPDGTAFDLFDKVCDVPIIVLTGLDEIVALSTVKRGAFEYVLKHGSEPFGHMLHKAIEQALNSVKQRVEVEALTKAFNHLRDCVFITDTSDRIAFVNPAFEERYGYRLEEVRGQPVSILWSSEGGIPNPKSKLPQSVSGMWIYNVTKSGERIPVFLSRSPWADKVGNVIGTVGVVREVIELLRAREAFKESESRFQHMAEIINQVFWLTDIGRTHWFYLSPQFEKLWGVTLQDLAHTPKIFYDKIHIEDRQRIMERTPLMLHGAYDEEYRVIGDGDNIKWVREKAFPVLDEQGRVVRLTGFIEDITQKRLEEQKREELEAQLRQAQKLEVIGQLAGEIAHEFNNILGSIIGYTQLALEDLNSDSLTSSNLKEALIAGQRAKQLVKRILTFSRPRVQDVQIVNVKTVINEAVLLLNQTIQDNIKLNVSLCDKPIVVLGDSDDLRSVLVNLCNNAMQAMCKNGGELSIELSCKDFTDELANTIKYISPGCYTEILVRDTGCGMSFDVLNRVFEPFFSNNAQSCSKGLGLSMVYELVRQHGGAINAMSEEGQGTCFMVYVPRIDVDSDDVSVIESLTTQSGHGTVLFVGAERQFVTLASLMLRRLGYEVDGVVSSEDALKSFRHRAKAYDVVFTDMAMPRIAGDMLGRLIHEIRSDVPLILCTGYADLLSLNDVRQIGFKEVLYKPVGFVEIARAIKAVCGNGKL